MKFVCEKALLFSGISVASRTVAQKSTVPALEGILVKAGETLQLTGYNAETGITVSVPADIRTEGVCVIPARLFQDYIRRLPDEPVSVEVNDNLQVSIHCGESSITMAAMNAESFPELPEVEQEKTAVLPQRALKELIGGTIFSVSDNQARPVHTGCLFEIEEQCVTVVAVDGYRLALRRFHPEQAVDRPFRFVAPGAALKEVEKILTDGEDPVHITLDARHILFELDGVTLTCRLLEGEFLEWRRVIPVNSPIRLSAGVAMMAASVDRVGLVISEKVKSPVRCIFKNNQAEFRAMAVKGTTRDICPLEGDGGDLEIGFNCRFLLEALQAIPEENTRLELSNGLSPIVFTPIDGGDRYAYMVLPVRLKEAT